MSRDTRPESRTRYLDVPVDPLDNKRDEFFASQLELIASEHEGSGRMLGATILKAAAVAQRDDHPTDGSAVIRTMHAWFRSEREIPRDDAWTAELVRAAATASAFRSIPTSEFLLGVAMGLRGETIAPGDASPAFRMGLRAVLDCERGRAAGMTQLVVAADTEPDRSSDLDEDPTRPHACAEPVPPPLLDLSPQAPSTSRPAPPPPPLPARRPVAPEEDAPERRGSRRNAVHDDDLTRAHLIPKTEQLPQNRRK